MSKLLNMFQINPIKVLIIALDIQKIMHWDFCWTLYSILKVPNLYLNYLKRMMLPRVLHCMCITNTCMHDSLPTIPLSHVTYHMSYMSHRCHLSSAICSYPLSHTSLGCVIHTPIPDQYIKTSVKSEILPNSRRSRHEKIKKLQGVKFLPTRISI